MLLMASHSYSPLSTTRASEPQEISHIHELREHLVQRRDEGHILDQQISRCKEELNELMENRENWR